MADNFDLKKFITESKLKIKVPVKEMARIAKEKYKLNSDFPNLEDRIKNPNNFKLDRKQQVINYFVQKSKDENINPMEVELLKSDIEKNSAPGVNWSFTPDIRTGLLKATSVKPEKPEDEEEGGEDYFTASGKDAEDFFIGKSKFTTKKAPKSDDDEEPSEKDIPKIKAPKITGSGMRAGEFFIDNSALIDRIIRTYSTSMSKVGRVREAGGDEIGSGDFKKELQRSKEAAKAALPDLVKKLVDEIEKLKEEDFDAYIKVLNDLDKYKFGATNTKGVMKQILAALGEPKLPEMGTKRKKDSEEDELKKLGIDDEPIKIDDEEEL
jgi:hypothetical protein